MNSLVRPPRRSQSASESAPVRPDLRWIHDGVRYRVTLAPGVKFQREIADRWAAVEPAESVFASAALGVTATQWRRFLEYLTAAHRDFLERFQFSRMAALHVLTSCPTLLPALQDVPALT